MKSARQLVKDGRVDRSSLRAGHSSIAFEASDLYVSLHPSRPVQPTDRYFYVCRENPNDRGARQAADDPEIDNAPALYIGSYGVDRALFGRDADWSITLPDFGTERMMSSSNEEIDGDRPYSIARFNCSTLVYILLDIGLEDWIERQSTIDRYAGGVRAILGIPERIGVYVRESWPTILSSVWGYEPDESDAIPDRTCIVPGHVISRASDVAQIIGVPRP